MDVLILGAGRPARGSKPSALKNISLNTKVLDWQIRIFENLVEKVQFRYLGGYQVDEVIQRYPQLNFTVIPDWEDRHILHTLLQAPFSRDPIIVTYADTIFRKSAIQRLLNQPHDIVFAVDSRWVERYESRSRWDMDIAEKIHLENFDNFACGVAEFTGLISFKAHIGEYLSTLIDLKIGTNLVDLLQHLKSVGYSIKTVDITTDWAEFNSPADIAHFILGSKSETLARLEPLVKRSHIGEQVSFTVNNWRHAALDIVASIEEVFKGSKLIFRSSAVDEDRWDYTNAGSYASLLNIDGSCRDSIINAVDSVIQSYGKGCKEKNLVLVQRCLSKVRLSGVVFTCGLETGSPYYYFNFDQNSHTTNSVTSGSRADLRTVIVNRLFPEELHTVEPALIPVLEAAQELEDILGFNKLDIEFAINEQGIVHILQVRPIVVDHSKFEADKEEIEESLKENISRFQSHQHNSPFILGKKAIFSNMSDWNPAEIIGSRPRPLAFSLYSLLITNDIWAKQRAQFGYRDVRPSPLIFTFSGQPYVDVRASLNSFVPQEMSDEIACQLVDAYLDILAENPHFHDKIEFEVAFTTWFPEFQSEARKRLKPYGLMNDSLEWLESSLKNITRNAFIHLDRNESSIYQLKSRRNKIKSSNMVAIDKIFALLDDCRRFGTIAFAHSARGGFIAATWLKSLVSIGILTNTRFLEFMRSIKTVAGEFTEDKISESQGRLSTRELIERYGHLRPGTYEVTANAYWEKPLKYFEWDSELRSSDIHQFEFSSHESKYIDKYLAEMGSDFKIPDFSNFLKRAIQAREYVKFEFSKNLSSALDLCVELADKMTLSRDDISFLEYHDLEQLKLNTVDREQLLSRISYKKKYHSLGCVIELPTVIQRIEDFYCFERQSSQPNFVTMGKAEAEVAVLTNINAESLAGKIVCIPQADPGFDWLLGLRIGGLITKYGGANSHMAIRAAEIGLPAAIGVGEKMYEWISRVHKLELNCGNRVIREVL